MSDKAHEASPWRSLPGQSGIVGSCCRPLSRKGFRLSLSLMGPVYLLIQLDAINRR